MPGASTVVTNADFSGAPSWALAIGFVIAAVCILALGWLVVDIVRFYRR